MSIFPLAERLGSHTFYERELNQEIKATRFHVVVESIYGN